MSDKKPILCLDFDGVIHAYTSGWRGIDVIPDGPVPGAIEFIQEAQKYFRVVVYSSRSENTEGINAMMRAISEWVWDELGGDGRTVYEALEFPRTKPSAFVTLDDRAVTFVGRWPRPAELRDFRPWNKCTSGEIQRTLAELTRPAELVEWESVPSILSQEERIRLERVLGEFARAVQMTQRITDHREAALYLQHASAAIVGLVDRASMRMYHERAVRLANMAPPPALERSASHHFAETSPSIEPQVAEPYVRPISDRLVIPDPHYLTGPEWSRLEELLGTNCVRVDERRDLVAPVAVEWPPSDETTVQMPTQACLLRGVGLNSVLEMTREADHGQVRRYLEIRQIVRPMDDQYWELTGPLWSPRALLARLEEQRSKYSFEPSPPATAEQQDSMLDEPGG